MMKLNSSFSKLSLGAIALAFATGNTLAMAQTPATATHDGHAVSITADKLVMTNEKGKEHSHAIAADVVLTLDGKACKWSELKPGLRIRVTSPKGDEAIASRIEALDKNLEFAGNRHEGKIVSVDTDKLVMTLLQGKDEHTLAMNADTRISCDGKVRKSSDLKPGMKIRVTMACEESKTLALVEALDRNPDFDRNHHDGMVVNVKGETLALTLSADDQARECVLRPDVKITCDGRVCKISDLKPGMRIRVTLESDAPQSAARIEALLKNPEFASL